MLNLPEKLPKLKLCLMTSILLYGFTLCPASVHATVSTDSLSADTMLKRSISYEGIGVSLEYVLQGLSKDGVHLACDAECAQQKLQLRIHQRPLYQVMEALAELLPGEWVSTGTKGSYMLRMAPKAVQRRRRWWEVFNEERTGDFANLRNALLQAIQRPVTTPPIVLGNPAAAETLQNRLAATRRLLQLMPVPLQQEIVSRMDMSGFYSARSVEVEGGNAPAYTAVRLTALPEAAQQAVLETIPPQLTPASKEDVVLAFGNFGISIQSYAFFRDGKSTSLGIGVTGGELIDLIQPAQLDQTILVVLTKEKGDAAPASWKVLTDYRLSRVWPNTLPPREPTQPQNAIPFLRADVLRWIGEKGDIDFISDYYSIYGIPLSPSQKATPIKKEEITQLLNLFARDEDSSWKQGPGGIYLFRDNRWYRDDALEIPELLLNRWLTDWGKLESARPRDAQNSLATQATTSRNGQVQIQVQPTIQPGRVDPRWVRQQLDWELLFLNKLTFWQIANGLENAARFYDDPQKTTDFPFLKIGEETMHELPLLSFYQSLQPAQRQSLVEGKLPLSALTADQMQLATAIAPRILFFVDRPQASTVMLGIGPSTSSVENVTIGLKPEMLSSVPVFDLTLTLHAPNAQP